MEKTKRRKISIDITDNKDRRELFELVCDTLNVSTSSMKSLVGVKTAIPSYDSIFKLLIKHKLDFTFEGESKTLIVMCRIVDSKGHQQMDDPNKVKETSVDSLVDPPIDNDEEGDPFSD